MFGLMLFIGLRIFFSLPRSMSALLSKECKLVLRSIWYTIICNIFGFPSNYRASLASFSKMLMALLASDLVCGHWCCQWIRFMTRDPTLKIRHLNLDLYPTWTRIKKHKLEPNLLVAKAYIYIKYAEILIFYDNYSYL